MNGDLKHRFAVCVRTGWSIIFHPVSNSWFPLAIKCKFWPRDNAQNCS